MIKHNHETSYLREIERLYLRNYVIEETLRERKRENDKIYFPDYESFSDDYGNVEE